ncbi:MAG TPA: hypothetical protein VFL77_12490 [Solirubrobacterales bacterium]|nr:hypothetical protein [Solirubrobacterales bacterium]
MSRIRILALLATFVALAGVLAACGGGGSDNSNEDPRKVLEEAGLEGVKSGELELSVHVNAEVEEGGEFDASLSGPFEAGGKEELPQLEMAAEANGEAKGEKIDFEGKLTLLKDRAFVEYKGTPYEIDPTTFGFLKSAFEQAQQEGGSEGGPEGGVTACQKAAEGIRFSQFADHLENEGSEEVGGTSTTKISGDVNVGGAIDALIKLTEDPACSSQLEAAGPLPLNELEEAKGELSKAIKASHVEINVGDDHIVRKFALELTVEPPQAKGEKVELEFEVALNGVNETQSFSEPSNAKPLEELFQQLKVNPLELLEGARSEGLGGLLEGITGGSSGGGASSGGGSSSGGESGPSAEAQKEYVQCLQKARNAADLQKCASLLK